MTELKTIVLDVIKKNRVYFKCLNDRNYEVKLRITPESENLQLGKQELLVEDHSVRTKYGTDIIYQLKGEIKDTGIITLKHRYNHALVESCRNLGGRWDGGVWVFPKMLESEVEMLDEKYNSDMVVVEIEALEDLTKWRGEVTFCGYPLARAWGRDSGAKVCDNVHMLAGEINSGGSVKNWVTRVEEGTRFKLEVSKNLIEDWRSTEEKEFKISIVNG